ncbi:transglutaminase-like domain-containing protein [Lapillicoccus jejuensis]|uniref:Transglutaminase superfamily protein n=1 Tax=Lapillicoccus jejuensis TaxID=402171 RepID=A0A542DZ62_9MICO|nr:transglutaminase-like domain-containing protein [Lapillicoccus jejuensis]TQJ08378.1 transglutaminase superfamily protein [Lapillicoccus jejuensis]
MTSPFQAPPEHLLRREPTAREKAAARLRALRPGAARLVDAGFAAALVLVALLGLRTTYDGWLWLVPGVVGLVLGVVVTHAVLAWRLPGIVAALVLTVLYALLGGAVATRDDLLWGFLPTGATVTELARTAVLGWKQLLTSLPPIDSRGPLMALPLVLGLVGGALAYGPAARWRLPAAAVPVPLALLTVSLLLGTPEPAGVLVMGLGSGLLLVGWVALRGRFARPSVDHGTVGTDRTAATWRVATTGVLLLLAGTGGWLLGPGLPGDDGSRTIWRTALVPPYDVSQLPSPLAGFRKYTQPNPAKLYDRTLFTVSGLPAGTPVRLATLDSYDGSVWGAGTAAADAGDGSGEGPGAAGGATGDGATFQRVGSHIAASGDGTARTVTVSIPDRGWSDVWLPTVGTVTGVRFAGDGADGLADDLRFNVDTGTGIVPAGLQGGDRYTLEADVPATPTTLPKDLDVASGSIIDTQAVGFADDKVATWTANLTSPWQRFTAVARAMSSDGAYTDGGTPGSYQNVFLPGHSLSRMTRFFKSSQLAGDDEQYASALALVGNRIGVPTRVVLGAIPTRAAADGSLPVTGKDVHAWVEVQTEDGGWFPVLPQDFVPNRNKQPQQQQQRSEEKKVGAQVPPPVSANPPSVLQGPDQSQNSTQVKKPTKPNPLDPSQWPSWMRWLVVGVGGPVLVLGLAYLALRLAKRRRGRRRRTRGSMPERVAGAWAEVVDTAQDLGMPLAPRLTRLEQATVLDALLATPGRGIPRSLSGAALAAGATSTEQGAVLREQTRREVRQRAAGEGPLPSLRPLADTTNGLVFAAADPTPEQVDAVWVQVRDVTRRLRRRASRRQRLRSDVSLGGLRKDRRATRAPSAGTASRGALGGLTGLRARRGGEGGATA